MATASKLLSRSPRIIRRSLNLADDDEEEQLIDTEDVVKPTPDTLSPDYNGSDIKGRTSFNWAASLHIDCAASLLLLGVTVLRLSVD
jgi:hypothetical protein